MTMPLVHGFCGARPSQPKQILRVLTLSWTASPPSFLSASWSVSSCLPLIFEFFGHGVCSHICGVFCGSKYNYTRYGTACPQTLLVIVFQASADIVCATFRTVPARCASAAAFVIADKASRCICAYSFLATAVLNEEQYGPQSLVSQSRNRGVEGLHRDIYDAVCLPGHGCTMPQPCFSCPVAQISLYCNLQQQEKIHTIKMPGCQSGMTATWHIFSSREVAYGYESSGWRWSPQWSCPGSFPGLQSSHPTLDETRYGNRAVHGPESGRQAVQRGPQREVKAGF